MDVSLRGKFIVMLMKNLFTMYEWKFLPLSIVKI